MKFEIDNYKYRLIISQAVIMKVIGIKDLVSNTRYPWIFDIRHEKYGIISVKQGVLTRDDRGVEGYRFVTENKKKNKKFNIITNYDTYFCLGLDFNWKVIESVYIIPNEGWVKSLGTLSIYRSYSSKYDEFKIDSLPYHNAFCDLMSKVGTTTMIDTNNIRNWLKDS